MRLTRHRDTWDDYPRAVEFRFMQQWFAERFSLCVWWTQIANCVQPVIHSQSNLKVIEKKFKFPLVSMSRAFVVRSLTGLFIQWQFACWHNVQTSETIFIRFNQRRFATCALLAPCFNCMKLNLDFGVVVELSFSDKIFISSTEEWHLALLPERENAFWQGREEEDNYYSMRKKKENKRILFLGSF